MIAFIAIGGSGLVLLILSMVVGEIVDLFDGIFSTTALGVGAVIFGASGYLVLANGGPNWLAYTLAGVLGAVALALGVLLTRWMKKITAPVVHDLIGMTGITTSFVFATGKVQLSHSSEINQRLAFADEEISQGAEVTVVAVLGDKVKVHLTPQNGS